MERGKAASRSPAPSAASDGRRELGVYVHFPWCRRRCPYCDFAIAVAPLARIPHERYADAVLEELDARAPRFRPGRALRSIYFGGGTPALWRADCIARVVVAVRRAFDAERAPLEVTVEANPNDCTAEALRALRAAGANRLSIGAQAFDDRALVQLGRDHGAAESRAAVARARAAGFENVSLDLIYALPGRTLDDWRRTLDDAVAAAPDHLSVYQLTIEDRTTFGEAARRGRLRPVPDAEAARQFEEADRRLGEAGYEHYEVSSYARPGRRAVHNSLYWSGAEYLGLGNAAHSFWRPGPGRGVRWWAPRSVVAYLAARPAGPDTPLADDPLVAGLEEQEAAALAEDEVWLGVRTADGVATFADGLRGREAEIARLVAAGFLEVRDGRVRPTPRGFLYADEIGVRLLQSR